MSFTYDTSNPTDITSVRYHLADTVEADAIWSDEDITYAITLNDGSWQRAVVSLIEQYITTWEWHDCSNQNRFYESGRHGRHNNCRWSRTTDFDAHQCQC